MKANLIKIIDTNIINGLEEFARAIAEGRMKEGDIIARRVFDEKEKRSETDEIYELVIEVNPNNKEIKVIRQYSDGDVALTQYKVFNRSIGLRNLDRYAPGSEEYIRWKKKFEALEMWRNP